MKALEGKNAIVTGASRGIGRAVAEELARHGANIAINYNQSQDSAEECCNVLRDLGRVEQAIESYQQAIKLNPDYAEPYNNLGNVLREQGKLDEAVTVIRQALDGARAQAEQVANRALQTAPRTARATIA